MSVFFYILSALLLLHGIYRIVKYMIIAYEQKEYISKDINSSFFHDITVLIPVLHEEKNIEKVLSDMAEQDYPKESFEVCVVTSEKEYLTEKKENTIQILDKIIRENRFSDLRIRSIHYSNTKGAKADQLDFALGKIKEEKEREQFSRSFFLFLDADSNNNRNTLKRFNDAIEEGVEIYQQPLLWLKNLSEVKSPLMQAFAFWQSFFSIAYEMPMFEGRFFPWRIKYLVGHGLFLKGSFILRIGGLPSVIEDVRIGRMASFLGVRTKLVRGFGLVETAKKFSIYIKQSSVWFFGCGLFLSDYRVARNIQKNRSVIKDTFLILYGFFQAFRWQNKGLLHVFGLIYAATYSMPLLFTLFMCSLLIDSSIPVLLLSKDFSQYWNPQIETKKHAGLRFRSVLFAPILYIFNFVGLYYGLFKIIKFYIKGDVSLPKTER